MPSKKKKYNARFPASRIKKIMQTDEEIGKVAQAVPVIISRTLELFVESLLTKSAQITRTRNAKTLTPSHMKQCILSESRFDFLKDLVKNIPDVSTQEDSEIAEFSNNECPKLHKEQSTSKTTSVIQYGEPSSTVTSAMATRKSVDTATPKLDFSIQSLVHGESPPVTITLGNMNVIPPLVPIMSHSNNLFHHPHQTGTGDTLCIDEDYDN